MPAVSSIKKNSIDPLKKSILDRIGDLSWYEIANNEVLCAIYLREEKTAGGIILPHQNLKEDLYQAKVHLVVKIGSACQFVRTDSNGVTFGVPIKLHDWVVLQPSHAWALDVNPDIEKQDIKSFVHCRMVFDDQIKARVDHPSRVW